MRTDRYTSFALMVSWLITNSFNYAQQPDSAIATIVSVKSNGRIWIKSKASRQWDSNPKTWWLFAGDSVKTDGQMSATLLYCRGQAIQLGRKESHLVTDRKETSTLARLFHILKVAFNQETPLAQGASRGVDNPPVLIYPCYGKILSNRPAVAWLASAPGTEYRIQVFDADDRLIWETMQKDTMLTYPSNAPQLLDSVDYQIEISRKYKDAAETSGSFSIASAEQRTKMTALLKEIQTTYKSSDPTAVTSKIVSAAVLMKEEYFTDAVLVLNGALKKQPTNRTVRTMLAQIYEQVGPPVLIKPMLK